MKESISISKNDNNAFEKCELWTLHILFKSKSLKFKKSDLKTRKHPRSSIRDLRERYSIQSIISRLKARTTRGNLKIPPGTLCALIFSHPALFLCHIFKVTLPGARTSRGNRGIAAGVMHAALKGTSAAYG